MVAKAVMALFVYHLSYSYVLSVRHFPCLRPQLLRQLFKHEAMEGIPFPVELRQAKALIDVGPTHLDVARHVSAVLR